MFTATSVAPVSLGQKAKVFTKAGKDSLIPSHTSWTPHPPHLSRVHTCACTHTGLQPCCPYTIPQVHTSTSRLPHLLFPLPGMLSLHTSASSLSPPTDGSSNTTFSARPALILTPGTPPTFQQSPPPHMLFWVEQYPPKIHVYLEPRNVTSFGNGSLQMHLVWMRTHCGRVGPNPETGVFL